MTTPNPLDAVALLVEAPLEQFTRGDTAIYAVSEAPTPTSRCVMILRNHVMLWASRAELAPILFPGPPLPTPCPTCQVFHDRYICAYPDRVRAIGREWDAHRQAQHPHAPSLIVPQED